MLASFMLLLFGRNALHKSETYAKGSPTKIQVQDFQWVTLSRRSQPVLFRTLYTFPQPPNITKHLFLHPLIMQITRVDSTTWSVDLRVP